MALDTRLISVTIVYCKNNTQWKKEIDLDKAGGLWWNNGGAANTGNDHVPGKKTKLPDPCKMELAGDGSACWWDNRTNSWVCPDGLGG